MAQVLVRNLDDELLERYRSAAKANGRALEAELRDGLARGAPERKKTRSELAAEVRALMPKDLPPGPSGTDIIRYYRDTNGGRWPLEPGHHLHGVVNPDY